MLFIFSFQLIDNLVGTFRILLVPDIAERTTIFFSPSVINLATSFIRCAEPTEVPPNFKTFIFVTVLKLVCIINYYFLQIHRSHL